MTRDEAIAKIRPFLPTNPTHPSTHVSIPLEALKKVLADLDEAIEVGEMLWLAALQETFDEAAMDRWDALGVKLEKL
jgi:hypothetical protein